MAVGISNVKISGVSNEIPGQDLEENIHQNLDITYGY